MFFHMVYKSGQIFLPFCHNPRVWRTDGRTEFSSQYRVCITCSAVKIKLLITQPGIARFRSNFVRTLITWHLVYNKCSRSRGQRSRSRRDNVSPAKNRYISRTHRL